jgi:hypothetical protein
MDYYKQGKARVPIKGQKMVILVYIQGFKPNSVALIDKKKIGILLSQAKIYLPLFCFPLSKTTAAPYHKYYYLPAPKCGSARYQC